MAVDVYSVGFIWGFWDLGIGWISGRNDPFYQYTFTIPLLGVVSILKS